ncbi:P-type conjugative transfer protein TrbJ [Prosthecochloris sp. ZM_2]|uniref:P-type conjugative transfer protein TrbJ n=1 Tax=Prosthecochloris sp. ZM_2 TaxID=2045206 RepID=UPI000DF72384|nr:P-type conjugative transfer protein TrbJ [Prosthecochloris sp. ZM_2]RNA64501.1 P-type conjugative transfer protein TrbJ [Prosthecochloris sp. ZM_2]
MNVRRLSGCVALVLSVLLISETGRGPRVALGAWPVIDVANLNRNTVTSVQMVQDVIHQVTQIENQIRQYEAMLQTLKRLDSQTFLKVKSLLGSQREEMRKLFYNIDSIGFNISQIDAEFSALFPERDDWATIDMAGFKEYYRNWNNELQKSAKTAMKAQASIQRVQDYNNEMQNILMASDMADGEVRQLQSQNQMLAVMSNQIGDLSGTLVASGRITATMAARAAAQENASLELKKRALDGYGGERTSFMPIRSAMP